MTTSTEITVIGLGPMGQAMVRSLLASGRTITIWNRTSSRAEDLVEAGALRAKSPADAVRASELVILSLTDYQAMYDILGDVTDLLGGRTIVNLSSDSPARTREAAAWAAAHGASLIVGGVMTPAPMVGTDDAYVYYSGSPAEFERCRAALAVLGEPRFLGEEASLAQLMYQAQLDVFLTTLAAVVHAAALLESAGLPTAAVMPDLLETVRTTPEMGGADAIGHEIDSGVHPGHLSTAIMMGATADHIVQASEEAGIDLALPRAVQALYRAVIDQGNGRDNWTRIVDPIRNPISSNVR